jgi:lysophospholipase L1-like esterase
MIALDIGWGLAGITAGFVAAELAARWAIRVSGDYFVLPPGLRMRLTLDRHTLPEMEPETRFDVNRDGERGGDVPGGDNVYRVLVAGGSQAEGFFLDQDTSWPGALERRLQEPGALSALGASHVHVGSVARSGVGSEALDLIFERVLPRYPRLQLIVIMVGATDVLRWLEHGAPESISPVTTSDVFCCHPEMAFGWRPGALASAELVRRLRRRWLRPIEHRERVGRWVGRARALRADAEEIRTTTPDPAPMLDHFTRHFERLLNRAERHADRVLVVRQPWFDKVYTPEEARHMWHGGVGQAWSEQVTSFYSFDVCTQLMRVLDCRAAALLTARGTAQIDLMPVLEPSLATYYDGFHLTPTGARAVAHSVAAAVLGTPATRDVWNVA